MEYLQKYTFNNLLSGGSYKITSEGSIEKKDVIIYPEVSILVNKFIGRGGSGSVNLGVIISCNINPTLVGKHIAIKNFMSKPKLGLSEKQTKDSEKAKMLEFKLDEDNKLVETQHIASIFFDVDSGPLANSLIYEFGGDTLCSYVGKTHHTLENNKRIMRQLFTVLYELQKKDNMHNDIKCENIVYSIDSNNNVNIKLIDFGSSKKISKLNSGEANFSDRTNMNTPETIYNHLKSNNYQGLAIDDPKYNNFNRWYYYPFISIITFLFTGKEYSSGDSMYVEPADYKDRKDRKNKILINLLDNNNIKTILQRYIYPQFNSYLPKLYDLIDKICIPEPLARTSEDIILSIL